MLRRVLVVSPNFPPVNAADHQRVRISLPYFQRYGWDPHVLCLETKGRGLTIDTLLDRTVPDTIPITRVATLFAGAPAVGDRGMAYRALAPLASAGSALLKNGAFDLVYISTTMFPVMALGPLWQRLYGVPYVVDFQDPWTSSYYADRGITPPGGHLKYAVSRLLANVCEPPVVRNAGHVISVSPAYVESFQKRYPEVERERYTVLPFGASSEDFRVVDEASVTQTVFSPSDGLRHWGYLGRGGSDMRKALTALFDATRAAGPRAESLRMHFVGTSYALGRAAEQTVAPVAESCGVGHLVEERTGRIPFFEGLRFLMDCDAILIVGSDDAGYTASKIYPCILARRPILAFLHESSTAVAILRQCNAGTVVTFGDDDSPESLAARARDAVASFLAKPLGPRAYDAGAVNWDEFLRHTAAEMTREQCRAFDDARRARRGGESA